MRTVTVLIAALATMQSLKAQETPVVPDQVYQGGARLTSELTGVSFALPSGFQGGWDPTVGGVLAASPTGLIGGVWAWSEGTAEEVADEVGQLLADQGIELAPRGELETLPNGVRGSFDALTPLGNGLVHAVVVQGPSGGVATVAALGDPATESAVLGWVDDVVGSIEWSQPGAASWRGEVEGTVLTWTGGGSDVSPGATTATGASSGTATLALCALRQYRYSESSESYVSIPGATASSSSSDEHTGEWWLIADLVGGATLLLETTDGRAFRWSVDESADGYLIDGYLYTVSGGC